MLEKNNKNERKKMNNILFLSFSRLLKELKKKKKERKRTEKKKRININNNNNNGKY